VVSFHSKNEESYEHSTTIKKPKQIFPQTWAQRWVDSKADVNVVAKKEICDTAGIKFPNF
jgi:hypothetical protein